MSNTLRSEPERQQMRQRHRLLLRGIAHRLEGEFGHLLTRDTLEHYVEDSYEQLSSEARILNHVPAFVERFTLERLRALSKIDSKVTGHVADVLFVCERNDASSQIAAAIFNARAGGKAHARSAGSRPGSELVEDAMAALAEVNVDVGLLYPKPITPEVEAAADVVITLDAHDDIPVLEGKHYEAWRTERPAPHDRDSFRRLRDELTARVMDLIDRVVPKDASNGHPLAGPRD